MIFLRLCFGYLVQIVPFALLSFLPFVNHFRFSKRKTSILTACIILGCSLVFSISGTFLANILPGNHSLFQVVNLIFMLCLLPCLFWYIYAIKTIWQKKLFIFSFTLTYALIITSIGNMISTWIYYDASTDGLPYKGYTTVILLFVSALFLPLWNLLLKKYFIPLEEVLGRKESGHLAVLSLLLFAVLSSWLSFFHYDSLFDDPMIFFLYVALLTSAYIIYLLYFKMFSSLQEKHAAEKRYLEIEYNMQLLDKQYTQLQENIENSRRLKHDLKHHMLAIYEYLNQHDTKQATDYIQKYLQTLQDFELLKFCDHQIINMIVSHYFALAKEQDIDFQVHITLPKELPIANSDLTVLLGNLLENAVAAASKAKPGERNIQLNMILHRKMLAITVDNSFDGNIKCTSSGEYLSTKKNHNGMGLKSITDISDKYNGGVEFNHDDREFHSCVMIGLDSTPEHREQT